MMHDAFPDDPTLSSAVMFAELMGLTCSVCTPLIMSKDEVEAAATILAAPACGSWRAVDKSKPPIGIGAPTPSPCNLYADRQHWFLVSFPT